LGRTVIDVDAGCIVSSEETVTQEVRAKRQDEKGREVWWIATTNSARHTLIVLTEAERKVAKGNRETGTEP
jgi:hypothetical protein